MNSISVILATYNRAGDLFRLLEAYEAQTTQEPFEIIVVDDASSDQTWEVLKSYQARNFKLRFDRMEQNSGQGPARNRAIPLIDAPLVLFTGDDILPEKSFLKAHLAAHRINPDQRIAILGNIRWPNNLPVNSLMSHIDGIGSEQFSFYYLKDGLEYDFRHLYTSNISIKRSLLWSLDHWFDPDFTLYGFEDAELGYRLSQKGLRIRYSATPVGYHYHYHTVYSFADRQYKSGRMACVLVNKHPELRNLIYGKGLKFHLLKARLNSWYTPVSPLEVMRLENLALRMMSFHENDTHPLLDSFYVKMLNYFFYKGIIEGNLNRSLRAARITASFALPRLNEILNWYVRTSQRLEVALPEGFDLSNI